MTQQPCDSARGRRRSLLAFVGLLLTLANGADAKAADGSDERATLKHIAALEKQLTDLGVGGEFEASLPIAREVLRLRQSMLPKLWWKHHRAVQRLRQLDRILALDTAGQSAIAKSFALTSDWRDELGAGRYARAGEIATRIYEIRARLLGRENYLTIMAMHMLANNEQQIGRLGSAEALHREVVELQYRVLGAGDPQTLASTQNLAWLLYGQGHQHVALQMLERLNQVANESIGEEHSVALAIANNLGIVLHELGENLRAQRLLERTLQLCRQQHNRWLEFVALDTLAHVAATIGDDERAEFLFRDTHRQAVETWSAEHPETLKHQHSLATFLVDHGRYEEAEQMFETLTSARARTLGTTHPDTVQSRQGWARAAYRRGEFARARTTLERAASDWETTRVLANVSALERAQFDALTSPLPFLAACLAVEGRDREAWSRCEASLGRGLFDAISQRASRPLTPDERSRQQKTSEGLEAAERALKRAQSATDSATIDAARHERDRWLARRLEFESRLQRRYDVAEGRVYDIDAIRAQIPEHAALVMWLDVAEIAEHWAFVLTRAGPPCAIPLASRRRGSTWTTEQQRLTNTLRDALLLEPGLLPGAEQATAKAQDNPRDNERGSRVVRRSSAAVSDAERAVKRIASEVYEQRLAPVVRQLEADAKNGTQHDDVRAVIDHLIVVPVGNMAGIPIDVLTDHYSVSYAPSGTLFAWLCGRHAKRRPATKGARGEAHPHLLAVGDPRFDDAQRPVPTAPNLALADKTRGRPSALPETRHEVEAIAKIVDGHSGKSSLLVGPNASAARLTSLNTAGALADYDVLHFATHGIIDDRQPFRSALLLTPAPLSAASPTPPPSPVDGDRAFARATATAGRLTADEIRRTWQLDADLVTLSACQTGLGRQAGGEGYLGFTQAFFLAGARSLLVSLWRVDDRATALLMARFYFERYECRRSKSQALGAAQDWLRSLTKSEVDGFDSDLASAVRHPVANASATDSVRPYAHPYYWAGFILVGIP